MNVFRACTHAIGKVISRSSGASQPFTWFATGLVLLVSLLLWSVVTHAAAPGADAAVQAAPSLTGVAVRARVFSDSSGALSVDSAATRLAAGEGHEAVSRQIMPISGGGAAWYQLDLPAVRTPTPVVLTLPHPGLDTADLYMAETGPDGAPRWSVQRSGDKRPVAEWPVQNLYPAFGFTLAPGSPAAAYLRVTNFYPVSVDWDLYSAADFHNKMKNWYVLLGMYTGLAVLVLAVSCLQAVTWKEPICYFYAGYVVMVALAQLSVTGLAAEYLWPAWGWWSDRSLSTLPLSCSAVLHLFLRRVLAERDLPRVSQGLLGMAVLGGLLVLASLAPNRVPFVRLFGTYYLLSLLAYLGVSAWYAWQRPRVGIWILAGVICLAAGAISPVMRLFGLVPTTVATQYGAQGGAALQIPLLMAALYFRNREKRANLVRIGALPRVDPLTGTASHRVVLYRLGRLILQQRHQRSEGALIRIRVNNLLAIRHEHGLDAAQTAVVQLAAIVTGMAREGDTVGRHREGDFVWILQGQLERARIIEMAQGLIARSLAECPGLPPGTSLQLKLALAGAPFRYAQPEGLLQVLDDLLGELSRRPGTGLKFLEDTDRLHIRPSATAAAV